MRYLLITWAAVFFSTPLFAQINLPSNEAVETQQFLAEGDLLLIVPSSHGITQGLLTFSERLKELGIEVWIADPFSTWFLPESVSSLNKIPPKAYAQLIDKAHQYATLNHKKLYLFSFDRGVQRLLEALRLWQLEHQNSVLNGVILVSPNLNIQTPKAGDSNIMIPIAKATNVPIFLFSTEKSTQALRLSNIINALKNGGSDIFTQIIHGARNRFFFRPDATILEQSVARKFPKMVIQAMRSTHWYARPRTVAPLSIKKEAPKKENVSTGKLLPYQGQITIKDFELLDLKGQKHSLSDYKGQVVLLNFWATWCPPCIHEIPSMTRLNLAMADKPFSILAINLGEAKEDIEPFVKKHSVNFPILLDPKQSIPKLWNVFAFPTSFILDKSGEIRYSVAGGIDWNEPSINHIIKQLIIE